MRCADENSACTEVKDKMFDTEMISYVEQATKDSSANQFSEEQQCREFSEE